MTDPDGLSNLPIEWKKLSGVGWLMGTSYYAQHTAGGVSLRCEVTSGPSAGIGTTYNWSVVAPSGTSMTRVNQNKVWHIWGRASAGIALYSWLSPADVSFSALDFAEGTCPPTNVSGVYINFPPVPSNHPENGPWGIAGGNSATGCMVSGADYPYENKGTSWGQGGTFTWEIPQQYIDETGTRHTIDSKSHTPTIQSNGDTTMFKGGQSGSAALFDQTPGYE